MFKEMPKYKQILFILAVSLAGVVSCSDYIINPVISEIYKAFPDNLMGVNFIISGSSFVMCLTSLFVPRIMKILGSKKTYVISLALCFLSGVFGVAILDVTYMSVMRVICAISKALSNVAAVSILTEVLDDDNLRNKILGYYSALCAVMASIESKLAGNFGSVDWTGAYKAYWVIFPVLVLAVLFVPNNLKSTASEAIEKSMEKGVKKEPYGRRFYEFLVICLVFSVVVTCWGYFGSVYVDENALGDASLTGNINAVGSIIGIVPGLFLGWLVSKTKNKTAMVCYAIWAVALCVVMFNISVGSYWFIGICHWIVEKTRYAYIMVAIPLMVPKTRTRDALALVNALYDLSYLFGTYVVTFVEKIMKTNGLYTPTLIVWIVATVVVVILEGISSRKDKIAIEPAE